MEIGFIDISIHYEHCGCSHTDNDQMVRPMSLIMTEREGGRRRWYDGDAVRERKRDRKRRERERIEIKSRKETEV